MPKTQPSLRAAPPRRPWWRHPLVKHGALALLGAAAAYGCPELPPPWCELCATAAHALQQAAGGGAAEGLGVP
jgi:hypothetical protein